FFFSSRRRHTRFSRDWSSDVCSSDLFINKLAYSLRFPLTRWHLAEFDDPRRGDIVVFISPHDGKRLVKRVVGVAGDTVELRNNQIGRASCRERVWEPGGVAAVKRRRT